MGSKDERILAQLLAEAERIKQAIAYDRREHEARLADAAEALSRGEEVDGLTALLLKAKAANAERAAAPPPKRIEAKPDFVADSSGCIVAAPAPSVESARPAETLNNFQSKSEPAAAPKAPPFRIEPEPTPPPKAPRHPVANIPGFADHLALKAKEIEALRKMYPNQVPASVAFGTPDPQPGPEIVKFTLAPGGRIRRVGQ